jgi:hypothetical protein
MYFRFDRSVQLLDISGNHLETLDETSLQHVGLSTLENLNASANQIHYIHEKAFARQSKLQTVDLSGNNLVVIEPKTFIQNRLLETPSLANNKFLKIPDGGSFLNTRSLKVLDLSACNLSNIPPNTFQELPNLETLYISHNILTVMPLLRRVEHLNTLDLSHNYLTDFNSGVFSSSPKLIHINLSYNKLSTLNTTVVSQLAKVSITEDLKGNPWVCDCILYTFHSWCSSHGVDLEMVCSSPPKCNEKLWSECYKAGCNDSDNGVDQVEETERMDNTTVRSERLEKNGTQNASVSEEMTSVDYTRQPGEGLGNHSHQETSDSLRIRKQKQEIITTIIVYVYFAVPLLLLIVSLIALAINCSCPESRRSNIKGHAAGDPEASVPLQTTEC